MPFLAVVAPGPVEGTLGTYTVTRQSGAHSDLWRAMQPPKFWIVAPTILSPVSDQVTEADVPRHVRKVVALESAYANRTRAERESALRYTVVFPTKVYTESVYKLKEKLKSGPSAD